MDSGGEKANRTGNRLEKFVLDILKERGYTFVDHKHFNSLRYLEQPIFTTQYPLGMGIYNTEISCDFVLYHPTKYPKCLIIEAKWQQIGGSVDEKYPYLIANIKDKYPFASVIILDGGGYKKGAEMWLKKQVDNRKLLGVMNMTEFQKWTNNGGL